MCSIISKLLSTFGTIGQVTDYKMTAKVGEELILNLNMLRNFEHFVDFEIGFFLILNKNLLVLNLLSRFFPLAPLFGILGCKLNSIFGRWISA